MDRFSRLQLAELSGVAARTIRYYHSVGVLPRPGRAGKEAVYGPEHLERLRAITAMQARGLRLDAIREVFEAEVPADGDWREVFDPRYSGDPETRPLLDDDGLTELLGDRRPEILEDLRAAGYLERCGDRWRVPEPAMLSGALILYDVGTDIALSGVLRKLIRSHIADLADEMVRVIREASGAEYTGEGIRPDLDRFRDRFRAAAHEVGGATLVEEIERAVREQDS
ncbi:MerR family transcriptional regulator [Nocardia yunnanensis]|uniref:MerR family transcriptional regulator n=1 Tax=Nocardia yunnanensis TaxID=2382165 RepID=A0A386ZFE2_9NOCA|nr:MerR family transcriptional regulator [Nocardia yunnanensis]AYF75345.1 MerR family transcriptional regulator [Nocardia yunnanensis]